MNEQFEVLKGLLGRKDPNKSCEGFDKKLILFESENELQIPLRKRPLVPNPQRQKSHQS